MSPRSSARNEQMKAVAAAAILDAAERTFAVEGFHTATTQTIAKQAGVSKGLVFNYFPTKDDILRAVVERRLREQLAFWRDLRLSGPPPAQLRQIVDRAIECVLQYPDAHRIYFSLLLQPGASAAVQQAVAALKPAIEEYSALLEGVFARLGAHAPRVDALLFQAALHGLAQTLVVQPAAAQRPDLFPLDDLKERLVAALGTPHSSLNTPH